jgi:DNA transformation protein
MPVSDTFLDSLREILGETPEFRIKRMFGGAGVFSGELMFALAFDSDLYLRADPLTRPDFEAQGCAPFTYVVKDGATMQLGYWRAPEAVWDDAETAARWTRLAIEAAARLHAAKRKPRKKASAPKAKTPELLISGPWDEEG